MLAYTGWHTLSQYLAQERKRLEEDRKRAAATRRAHRALARRERLLADFEKLDRELQRQLHLRDTRRGNTARGLTLLRRRNRFVDALNAA